MGHERLKVYRLICPGLKLIPGRLKIRFLSARVWLLWSVTHCYRLVQLFAVTEFWKQETGTFGSLPIRILAPLTYLSAEYKCVLDSSIPNHKISLTPMSLDR